MSRLSKRPQLLQTSEISEPTVYTDSDEAGVSSDASLVEGGTESVPPKRTTKRPVVMSPAVQFRPVPLKKRMPARVGQVNRFNRQ